MGNDGPSVGPEVGLRAVKPPPDRLYGRSRGHKLRPRQQVLLDVTLPRLALRDIPSGPLWLEVGFGGGEHAIATVRAHRDATLIAAEVFENGICSLLSALVTEGQEADGPCPRTCGFGPTTPASCCATCRTPRWTGCS